MTPFPLPANDYSPDPAFGILGGTMVLFLWGRLRYDLVAILALLASIMAKTAPADKTVPGVNPVSFRTGPMG